MPSGSRNVESPDSWEMPAPVSTTMEGALMPSDYQSPGPASQKMSAALYQPDILSARDGFRAERRGQEAHDLEDAALRRAGIAALLQHARDGFQYRKIAPPGRRIGLDGLATFAGVLDAEFEFAHHEFPRPGEIIGPFQLGEGLAVVIPDIHAETFGLDRQAGFGGNRAHRGEIEEGHGRSVGKRIGIDQVEFSLCIDRRQFRFADGAGDLLEPGRARRAVCEFRRLRGHFRRVHADAEMNLLGPAIDRTRRALDAEAAVADDSHLGVDAEFFRALAARTFHRKRIDVFNLGHGALLASWSRAEGGRLARRRRNPAPGLALTGGNPSPLPNATPTRRWHP